MSAANDKGAVTPFENDAFFANNGLLKLGYEINDKIDIELFGNTFATGLIESEKFGAHFDHQIYDNMKRLYQK